LPFDLSRGAPQKIAIIGGGISGLASAWLLSQHHHVTLYEAEKRLGGHARTVLAGRNGDQPVDTGFIVFNYANYPLLTGMFRELDVPVVKSEMSFGVSLGQGKLEYALSSGNAIFGQRSNIFKPKFYSMLRDILRFFADAEGKVSGRADLTIEALLAELDLGKPFREQFLYPICGAIWSTPASGIGVFPAEALIRFLRNHALMSISGQHQWWTVSGGSMSYVNRLVAALTARGAKLRTATPVRAVTRIENGVLVRAVGSEPERFDQVVFAGHADQTLALLTDPSPEEWQALGAVRFQDNRTVLHRDPRFMPVRKRCWSSWVYLSDAPSMQDRSVGVTYWMNRLQSIPESDPLFITLNPTRDFADGAVYDEVIFRHPVFDHAALRAQGAIDGLQGVRNSWFAGAWLKNGFHEDGFASAHRVAQQLLPLEQPREA